MERHLPYGIPQCYLPPNTGKPQPYQSRPVLELQLTIPEELKVVTRWFTCQQTYLSSNLAQHRDQCINHYTTLLPPRQQLQQPSLIKLQLWSLKLWWMSPCQTGCSPVRCMRNLGIFIDADLTMRTQVSQTFSKCFAALRQLRSIAAEEWIAMAIDQDNLRTETGISWALAPISCFSSYMYKT